MNRTDFQQLAEMRLDDAQVLFRSGRFAAGYYLAGYSVECGLKACIAKLTKAEDFPPKPKDVSEVYSHVLGKLLGAAGLRDVFEVLFKIDVQLGANWGLVAKWSEESRYELHGEGDGMALLDAVADASHGVLPCIKEYW
jgi:hypothetical protein